MRLHDPFSVNAQEKDKLYLSFSRLFFFFFFFFDTLIVIHTTYKQWYVYLHFLQK